MFLLPGVRAPCSGMQRLGKISDQRATEAAGAAAAAAEVGAASAVVVAGAAAAAEAPSSAASEAAPAGGVSGEVEVHVVVAVVTR